jgi:four helix bundle protein
LELRREKEISSAIFRSWLDPRARQCWPDYAELSSSPGLAEGSRLCGQRPALDNSIPQKGNTGLITQIRRAAPSVAANLAEGCGRASDDDFAKFVQIAVGSSNELEYHLQFACDTALMQRREFEARQKEIVEVRRMMIGLLKKLRPPPISNPS